MGTTNKETPTRQGIGANIRRLRVAQNLSQDKLAKMVDMDRSFLNKLEAGKRNTSVDVLDKLARGLNVPLFILFLTPDSKELFEYYYIKTIQKF